MQPPPSQPYPSPSLASAQAVRTPPSTPPLLVRAARAPPSRPPSPRLLCRRPPASPRCLPTSPRRCGLAAPDGVPAAMRPRSARRPAAAAVTLCLSRSLRSSHLLPTPLPPGFPARAPLPGIVLGPTRSRRAGTARPCRTFGHLYLICPVASVADCRTKTVVRASILFATG